MKLKLLIISFCSLLTASAALATDISVGLSGDGALNDSTVIAGVPFSVDVYVMNDKVFRGFTFGFSVSSNDIKSIVHVADSGNGLNEKGNIKGYNGWQDKSIWDLQGLFLVETAMDGKLPDTIGLGGICVKQEYKPHEKQKCVSFDFMAPAAGTLVFDSSFFQPSGIWVFVTEDNQPDAPGWNGPYNIKVVSKEAGEKMKAPKAEAAKKESGK